MRGEDHAPPRLGMFEKTPLKPGDPLLVDGGERLVEHPERAWRQRQSRQGHTTLLAGGKLGDGNVLETV